MERVAGTMKELGNRKVMIWNVAGLGRQNIGFWNFVCQMDYVCLRETWLEEKGWNRLKGRLPSTHEWRCCYARRVKRKGRAKGGFVVGRRKN